MNVKRIIALLTVAAALLALAACGGPTPPDTLKMKEEAYLLRAPGESLDLAAEVVIEGEKASREVVFSTDAADVVTVTPEGLLTAVAPGSAGITVTSAADKTVAATVEVLVYDFSGIYTTEKYIDAMGCNVRVNLEVRPDGTYRFYRYPMNVALEGGGWMEGFTDQGTWKTAGGVVCFAGEFFKEFSLRLSLDGGDNALLTGKTPTGGASTDMEFVRNAREDRGEIGTFVGIAETESGEEAVLRLSMTEGTYQLTVRDASGETSISEGIYSFNGNQMEFWADSGVSFRASYDADRQVVEGTEIPVSAQLGAAPVAVTLARK